MAFSPFLNVSINVRYYNPFANGMIYDDSVESFAVVWNLKRKGRRKISN